MNSIYLIKNGQNAGPYTEMEVRSRLAAGNYTLDDLAWFEGCLDPVPIARVFAKEPTVTLGNNPPPAPTPAPAPLQPIASELYSAAELTQIAKHQRTLALLGIGWLIFCFVPIPESFKFMEFPLAMLVLGNWIYLGWKLARLLRERPWVWVIFSLIPFLNYYAWVRIIWTATKTLRTYGVPCNFLGASQAALDRLGKTV